MGQRDITLRRYFDEQFEPEVLRGKSPNTVKQYRQAVTKFIVWSGCDITAAASTDVLIERWTRSLVRDGMTVDNARKLRAYLRRVLRHKFGTRCLKQRGHRPHEPKPVTITGLSDDDLICDGSLLKFWRDEYVPRLIGCSERYADKLRNDVSKFGRYLGRVPMLGDLSDENAAGFQSWQLSNGNSPHTVNSCTAGIIALWNYAARRKLVPTRPDDVERVPAPQRLPRAWSLEQLAAIIRAARQQKSPHKGIRCRAQDFWPALILVAYDTGLRCGSLFGIRLQDFDPDRAEVRVLAQHMKNRREMVFSLSEQTVEAVNVIMPQSADDDREELFPWIYRREHAQRAFRKILKRAGLYRESYAGCLFHQLRRTSATHLVAAVGWEAASRHLGHSSVEMTRRYVDVRFIREHKAADHLPRPQLEVSR